MGLGWGGTGTEALTSKEISRVFAAKVVSTDTVPAAIYSPCWSEKACKDQFSKAA